jgi:hypothetical protein
MPDRSSLFDGKDIVGVDWTAQSTPDRLLTDVDALRRFADRYEERTPPGLWDADFAAGDAGSCGPAILVRSAADELSKLRNDLEAQKKQIAGLNKQLAAWKRAAEANATQDLPA